jgi:hypothetical protein
MAITKADIPESAWPHDIEHTVKPLGGEVIVRSLLLWERLQYIHERNGGDYQHISRLLAVAVMDANREPLMSAQDWERFGAAHYEAMLELFDVAWRQSGFATEDAEKNSQAQNSSSP